MLEVEVLQKADSDPEVEVRLEVGLGLEFGLELEVGAVEAEVLRWVPEVVDLVVVMLDDFRPSLLVDWFPKFTRSYGPLVTK